MRDADIAHVHPAFGPVVLAIVGELTARGFDPVVYETWRSPERQAQLKAAGRSQLAYSLHQHTEGGQPAALAVDIISRGSGWGSSAFFDALADVAEAHGAVSGHRWRWRDSAHVQAVPVSAQSGIARGADPVDSMPAAWLA